MSREVIIKIRDDLDGSIANETMTFAIRGVTYEIDLSSANVELLEKTMQQFVDVARQVQTPAPLTNAPVGGGTPKRELVQRRREIRNWAIRNGWPKLAESTGKGRLPYDVLDAYRATHPEVELPPELIKVRAGRKVKHGPPDDDGDVLESITAQDMLALGGLENDGEVPMSDVIKIKGAGPKKSDAHVKASQTMAEKRRERFGDKLDSLDRDRRDEIRAWANANGFDLKPTGFIKNEALEAYFNAHPEDN